MPSKRPSLARRLLAPITSFLGMAPKRRSAVWAAASHDRLLSDWDSWIRSPLQEQRYELRFIRARSRELCRNTPHGRRFLNAITENVVGHRGIRLQARNVDASGDRDRVANARIEAAWADWGKAANCCVDRRTDWVGFQQLVMRTIAMDGEAFVRTVPGFENGHAYAVQLVDADQVDELYNVPAGPGQNRIVMGIEFDEWGAEVAYHVWTAHPYDASFGVERWRVRIPATEMHHLFVPHRGGAVRGLPWLAPVMVPMRHLAGYVEAEIVAARAAAAKVGFIEKDPEADAGEDPDQDPNEERFLDAAAGTVEELRAGEKFVGWDPQHPTAAYEAFVRTILQMTAAGANIGTSTLTGDYSQANYSSQRGEKLVERDSWRVWQTMLSTQLHEPVFTLWLPHARIAGMLSLSGASSQWMAHVWQARGWPWVDPLKDMQANAHQLALGLTTRARLAAEEGEDLEDLFRELAEEQDLAKEYGLQLADPAAIAGTGLNKPVQEPAAAAAPSDAADAEEDSAEAQDKLVDAIVARVIPAFIAMQPKSIEIALKADGLIPAPVVNVAPAAVTVAPADVRVEATILPRAFETEVVRDKHNNAVRFIERPVAEGVTS